MDKKDVDFKQKTDGSKCKRCQEVRPLLVEVNLCKICIYQFIPQEYKNDNDYLDKCIVCNKKIETGKRIIICNKCSHHLHDNCHTGLIMAQKGCPICDTPFSL